MGRFRALRYNPFRGSSYVQLPPEIGDRKACVNVNNEDQKCFVWSVLVAKYEKEKEIFIFGRNNDISINVFGYEDEDFSHQGLQRSIMLLFMLIFYLLLMRGTRIMCGLRAFHDC